MPQRRRELEMDPENPCPFVQPFLFISFRNESLREPWSLDVDGKIEKYIDGETAIEAREHNYLAQATPLLQAIIGEFLLHGWEIVRVGVDKESTGPTHVLRNGAIFKRIDLMQPY